MRVVAHSAKEFLGFDFSDLSDPALVTTTFERGREKHRQDLFGESDTNHPRTYAEHVRVVVFSRHASGVQVVAQRGPNATNLVRCQLLSLAAATQNNADVGVAVSDSTTHCSADRGVVATLRALRAMVVHDVTASLEHPDEVLLQFVAGVVRSDRNS